MKCLLITLVLNTFILKINAHDKIQLNLNESESNDTVRFNLFTQPNNSDITINSDESKIQKNNESNFRYFNVPDFSSEQIIEAFQSFGTRLKSNPETPRLNLIIAEDDAEKEKIQSGLAESIVEELKKNVGLKSDGIQGPLNKTGHIQNQTNNGESIQNVKFDFLNSNSNISNIEKSNYTVLLPGPVKSFDSAYFEVLVPQSEVKNDSEMRSILESVRDSVIEASNRDNKSIMRSDNVAVSNTNSIDRSDRVLGSKSSTHKNKSSRKPNHRKRYSYGSRNRNKKKSRKRMKNKRPVDNYQINKELKSDGSTNATSIPPHMKQDRRMVDEDLSHQFGLRIPAVPPPLHEFPYKFEPIEAHTPSNNSRLDNLNPVFQPRQNDVSLPFPHRQALAYQEHSNRFPYGPGVSTSSQFLERKNEYGPVTFGIDHGGYNEAEHHKSITLTKEIPVPYTVRIEKPVPYPVYVKVPYDKPYPVIVPRPYKVIHEVLQPYHVYIKVPKPYQVIKHVPKPVKVPVDRPYPVSVPKPYPVTVEKKVPVVVEKKVPYPVHVPVDRPYPVHVTVPKHVPYTVEKKYPVTLRVPVDKPYPVYIPRPYPVHVTKPVPHPVEKHVPYPVRVPVPYPVVKHVPVYENEPDTPPQHPHH